jgi:hypothetical protein
MNETNRRLAAQVIVKANKKLGRTTSSDIWRLAGYGRQDSMTDRQIPEYEMYSAEEVGKAWQKLRKQVQKGKPLTWTGPDRLHHRIAAGSPPPSHYLKRKWRKADKEQGRNIWDTLFIIAFQIGFHNGVLSESKDTEFYKRMADTSQDIARDADKRAKAMSEKVDRCEVHMREILGYAEGEPDAGLEAMLVRLKHYFTVTENDPATPDA